MAMSLTEAPFGYGAGSPSTNCSADYVGRAQHVSVLRMNADGAAATQLLAPSQLAQGAPLKGGLYLRFRVSGSVVVRVSQACARRGDAMLNAVFFDRVPSVARDNA